LTIIYYLCIKSCGSSNWLIVHPISMGYSMSSKKMGLALALALAGVPVAALAGSQDEGEQQSNGWFVGAGYTNVNVTQRVDGPGYTATGEVSLSSLTVGYRWPAHADGPHGAMTAFGVEAGGGNTH
jgi:hypothetical protein